MGTGLDQLIAAIPEDYPLPINGDHGVSHWARVLENGVRLSAHRPLFVSPHGTGCSRYVDVLTTPDGFYATWQQSQPDGSQPLVMNFLTHEEAEALLRPA